MDISWATNLKFTDFNIYIHKVQDRSFRSHTNVLFSSVRMCKWNGDKHWTKQDIQRVFWNIQLNNAHKIGVFYYEWNFLSTWFLSAGGFVSGVFAMWGFCHGFLSMTALFYKQWNWHVHCFLWIQLVCEY